MPKLFTGTDELRATVFELEGSYETVYYVHGFNCLL